MKQLHVWRVEARGESLDLVLEDKAAGALFHALLHRCPRAAGLDADGNKYLPRNADMRSAGAARLRRIKGTRAALLGAAGVALLVVASEIVWAGGGVPEGIGPKTLVLLVTALGMAAFGLYGLARELAGREPGTVYRGLEDGSTKPAAAAYAPERSRVQRPDPADAEHVYWIVRALVFFGVLSLFAVFNRAEIDSRVVLPLVALAASVCVLLGTGRFVLRLWRADAGGRARALVWSLVPLFVGGFIAYVGVSFPGGRDSWEGLLPAALLALVVCVVALAFMVPERTRLFGTALFEQAAALVWGYLVARVIIFLVYQGPLRF